MPVCNDGFRDDDATRRAAMLIRARFRRWRGGRPFWGGLWIMLGGGAILLAPLAPLPLIVRQGVAGVSGYLVGALSVAVGLLAWWQSGQRVFLGVAAMALSLASFVTSNFGGFGVGMVLGVVGGAMLVAWLPAKPGRRRRAVMFASSRGVRRDASDPGTGRADSAAGEGSRLGLRAFVVLPAFFALLVHADGGLLNGFTSAAVAGSGAVTVADSRLRAARLTMSGVRFHGTVAIPSTGGPLRRLKLTMDSARIADGEHRLDRAGGTAIDQRFSSLSLSGGVVLYATRLRARVAGVAFTLTPGAVSPPLPLPSSVTMTEIEADGLVIRAAHAYVSGLAQDVPV
jgi:hypothetical protein